MIDELFEKHCCCVLLLPIGLLIRAGFHKTILELALDISHDYPEIYLMTIIRFVTSISQNYLKVMKVARQLNTFMLNTFML